MYRRTNNLSGGSFKTMNLYNSLLSAIPFENPTPIQRKTLPDALLGCSFITIARTGSGKTLCYLIPAIQRMIKGQNSLILAPTKEIVYQIKKTIKRLCYGKSKVQSSGKIVVSTLRDDLDLTGVSLLVVDEFDRVLEEPSLKEHFDKILEKKDVDQKLFFSATHPEECYDMRIIQIENKIPDNIHHQFFYVPNDSKEVALLKTINPDKKTLVFAATHYAVDFLVSAVFKKYKMQARGIYSSMDDEARIINFQDFVNGKYNLLVVTDVAARGIDIPNLETIVNYDFCDEKTFIHRVGRIRRGGETVSLVTYFDMSHFFNIKETHLPQAEIGKFPQAMLDDSYYNMTEFSQQKFTVERGFTKSMEFRSKVVVPNSLFKENIQAIGIHSKFSGEKKTLADKLREYNETKRSDCANLDSKSGKKRKTKEESITREEIDSFHDENFIHYTKREVSSHSSKFGRNR